MTHITEQPPLDVLAELDGFTTVEDYMARVEASARHHEPVEVPLEEQPQNTVPHKTLARALVQYQEQHLKTECTFSDINEGDMVYRTEIMSDGSTVTYQGVATHYTTSQDVMTGAMSAQWRSESVLLADAYDELRNDIVLERIPRANVLYS